MKKSVWILTGTLLILLLAVAFVFKRTPGGGNPVPSLGPYVEKERVIYYDPAEMFKAMGLPMSSASMPPSALQPVMMRTIKLKAIAFPELKRLIEKDLTPGKNWHFMAVPSLGMPAAAGKDMILAYQGSSGPIGGPLMGFSAMGSEHSLYVVPISAEMVSGHTAPANAPKIFVLMESKTLSKWDVAWLKIKHLGKNPYSSQQDLQAMGEDF